MVEVDKTLLELFWWVVVESGKEKGEDCWKVFFDCRSVNYN